MRLEVRIVVDSTSPLPQGDLRLLDNDIAQADKPGTRTARIAVRPAWVGLLDFETRLPKVTAG
jgi:hypothetical protein